MKFFGMKIPEELTNIQCVKRTRVKSAGRENWVIVLILLMFVLTMIMIKQFLHL